MTKANGNGRNIGVDTSPTKAMVVDSITRDATITECLLDLIDNAVDAARRDMASSGALKKDKDGLAASFKGYRVALGLSQTKITISDNCGGISLTDLRDSVLRFGKRSDHPFAIGTYGVGLNRALFKLAKESRIETRTGVSGAVLQFDHDDYLGTKAWKLPARLSQAKSPKGTTIELSHLRAGIDKEIGNQKWREAFLNEASKRYYRFLKKGFVIEVYSKKLKPKSVELRSDGSHPIEPHAWNSHGVSIRIEAGEHKDHRFTGERDWDRKRNNAIAREFGWNIICNDRMIVISDQSTLTGWPQAWHNEYNGFVGYVYFNADDPQLLPWTTKKSGIDPNHPVFAETLKEMRRIAAGWRKYSRKASRGQIAFGTHTSAHGEGKSRQNSNAGKADGKRTAGRNAAAKQDHMEYSSALPQDTDEASCTDKLLKLLHEAKSLDITSHTYSGLLLLRAISQVGATEYLKQRHKMGALKEFLFDAQNQERNKKGLPPLPDDMKLAYIPSLDEICTYFLNNGDVWGVETFSHYKQSMAKLKKWKKTLNEVAHNPNVMVRPEEALAFRDEVVPLLRHLLNP